MKYCISEKGWCIFCHVPRADILMEEEEVFYGGWYCRDITTCVKREMLIDPEEL